MKKIITGDWHFGLRNDSVQHCEDLHNFANYLCDYGATNEIGYLYIIGDWFHNRDKIGVETLSRAYDVIETLNQQFYITMLVGNHDMKYRDTREINSITPYDGVADIIDNMSYIMNGKILLVPWLTNAKEYDDLVTQSKQMDVDYIIGHFEFSNFKMNDNYVMEHGQSHTELSHVNQVISGHYHKRQQKGNVTYVGSPIPMDMNDANDDTRGFCVLDTKADTLTHEVYPGGPKIMSLSQQEFLDLDFKEIIPEMTTIRVVMDTGADEKELAEVKDKLGSMNLRGGKVQFTSQAKKEIMQTETDLDGIMSVDEAVMSHLDQIEGVNGIEPERLKVLYKDITSG